MSEREQFEAWILKNWQTVHRENGRLTWHDSSVGAAIGHAWDGWKAGRVGLVSPVAVTAQPAQAVLPTRDPFLRERQQLEQEWSELRRLQAQYKQAVPVLTEREIEDMYDAVKGKGWSLDFARAIEQAVRAKMGVAVPMTDEQAKDIAQQETWGPDALAMEASLIRVIRHAERHHGIVGKEGA